MKHNQNEKFLLEFSKLENPTGKHKDWYRLEFLKIFCKALSSQKLSFDTRAVIREYDNNFEKLHLFERLELICELLNKHIDLDYSEMLKYFEFLLRPSLESETGMFSYGFHLYPVSKYIEKFGTLDIEASLSFIEKLTQCFTGEWAIRNLAIKDPKRVLKQMKQWARDENFHVRRLSSEGLRARLPWGKKVDWVVDSPERTLPIYNLLRNDPVLYVRRSVANAMGDMIKISHELAFETFNKWLDSELTPENLWVIKHAIRTPVKKKNQSYTELNQRVLKSMSSL